jgi:selenocysteine lyase/cysteine desulfurase
MERRHFLKSMGYIGGLAGGLVFTTPPLSAFSSASSFKDACAAMPVDEGFWRLVRDQFLLPKDYAYLNTGGLGACPLMVIDTVKKKMDKEDTYPSAGHDEKDWCRIKEKCAALLGPDIKKEELAFTSTATEGINIILNGLPLKKGDEIITSTHEHVALHIPLLHKMKSEGIVVKTFKPDLENAKGNVKRIEKLITKRTRLIFTSHITCTTGQIMPVKEIGELAKSMGLWYALDGVQALAHFPMNIKEMGVDFYAVSGHKWLLGPRRTGILYVRENLLDTLKPTVVGAYSNVTCDMEKGEMDLQPTAQRYEYGTQNDALFYGLEAAADFITSIGTGTIWKHNKPLSEMFYNGLKDIPELEILSPAEEEYRSAMVTFRFKNKENKKIALSLTEKGLRVRTVQEANLDGIRVSFHIYNNEKEMKRLLGEISA